MRWFVVRTHSVPLSSFILSECMANNSLSPSSRRGFLRLGVIAGLFGMTGCEEEGAVKKIETPAAPGGGRNRLQKLQEKTENLPTPKKKK